jgi:hypothetical protein
LVNVEFSAFREVRGAGKIDHPGVEGVSFLIALRNVWICRCQTFNVFIIPVSSRGWMFFYAESENKGSKLLLKTA